MIMPDIHEISSDLSQVLKTSNLGVIFDSTFKIISPDGYSGLGGSPYQITRMTTTSSFTPTGLRQLSYEAIQKRLDLFFPGRHRVQGDLFLIFKIINGLINFSLSDPASSLDSLATRAYILFDLRLFLFLLGSTALDMIISILLKFTLKFIGFAELSNVPLRKSTLNTPTYRT